MADKNKPRIRIPAAPKKGDVIEVKTLITHPMESGQRKDTAGKPIPRKIIHTMTVTYNGKPAFSGKFEPAMAANPYVSFFLRVEENGTLDFVWKDDDGIEYKAQQAVVID
jgi:sulfur-oxidizing protein SoxZ